MNFTKCQFNCIFVKEHRNLSKIIILPSCAEELRTAKQGNDLNRQSLKAVVKGKGGGGGGKFDVDLTLSARGLLPIFG